MADFRDMELLRALAKHRHFARAAEECGISQPAFSARIRNLEATLKVPIVQRGNRFQGFTAEGERVLTWAHKILGDLEGLQQDLAQAMGTLSGRLVLGCVPTALSYTARIAAKLHDSYPALSVRIIGASSKVIRARLETMEMDAGITYLDEDFPKHLVPRPLYEEGYALLCPSAIAPRQSGAATWQEAARLPLCLLSPEMHNRQIVDAVFESLGEAPKPVLETNAFTAALTLVEQGVAATIVPQELATDLADRSGAVRLALEEPLVTKPIGLVTIERKPELPALIALMELLKKP